MPPKTYTIINYSTLKNKINKKILLKPRLVLLLFNILARQMIAFTNVTKIIIHPVFFGLRTCFFFSFISLFTGATSIAFIPDDI